MGGGDGDDSGSDTVEGRRFDERGRRVWEIHAGGKRRIVRRSLAIRRHRGLAVCDRCADCDANLFIQPGHLSDLAIMIVSKRA